MVKRRKKKDLLTNHEKAIVALQKAKFTADKDIEFKSSLVQQFCRKGYLSQKQWFCVHRLVRQFEREQHLTMKPKERKAGYFVYAMQASERLKIGYSNDPKKRVRSIQTSNPDDIKLLKTILCENKQHAKNLEKRLQRKASKFHIRGEWFSLEALCVFE